MVNTIRLLETGRYLNPLLRDLERLDGDPWVEKYADDTGWWYRPRPGVRVGVPPDGMPQLLLFPSPYHPIEVLMVARGWGGRYPRFDLDLVRVIDAARQCHRSFIENATLWLNWPADVARVMFHLFTPWFANGTDAEYKLQRIRDRIWPFPSAAPRGYGSLAKGVEI